MSIGRHKLRERHYESGVIINATLEDSVIEALIEKIKTTIATNGGTITNVDNWGRKRLAYMINKHKNGYYVFFRYSAPTDVIVKIERFFKLEESIIRFITIMLDKKALDYFANQKTEPVEVVSVPVPEEVIEVSSETFEETQELPETPEEVKE